MSESSQDAPFEQPQTIGGINDDAYPIRFYIEDPAGDQYRAEAMSSTRVSDLAADFFEERGWPSRDQAGRPQRAVVEQVDPDDPSRTRRLRADQTLHDAGIRDDDTVRVLPELVAGAVSPHTRLQALVVDQREIKALATDDAEHKGNILVHSNADHAPTAYELTLHYPGVKMGDHGPELTTKHQVEIILPSDYPLEAPKVRWLTPIFHPNISRRGHVCLGILMDRYLPGLGLAYIVRMLIDMVRYRNYDVQHGLSLNPDAAKWADSEAGQYQIVNRLGGSPKEEPLDETLETLREASKNGQRQRIKFTPHDRSG